MKLRVRDVRSIARAAAELLLARIFLSFASGRAIASLAALSESPPSLGSDVPYDLQRIAFLIPRVGARLPWRTDCLVQALAARRWLKGLGYEAILHLGTRQHSGVFDAHAWVTWRGTVVSGGDIENYAPFRMRQVGRGE